MSELDRLAHLLGESEDRGNPDAPSLRHLLRATRRVAVVGASRDPLKDARRVPSYLAAKGFEIVPVNPHATWLFGRPALKHLDEVEESVDMVLIFRPSAEAGRVLSAAARRQEAPAIWLQEGIRADTEAAAAREAGLQVVQDLCVFKAHRTLDENLPDKIV